MAIKGLTDQSQTQVYARIFKGEVKGNNRPGKDTDYFRVVFTPGYEDLRESWVALYGDRPSVFTNIVLAEGQGVGVDRFFATWNEEYNGAGLLTRRCDGEKQVKQLTGNGYSFVPSPCIASAEKKCLCNPTGRLIFELPEFRAKTGVIGYVMFTVNSVNEIKHISAMLAEMLKQGVSIGKTRFNLSRRVKSILGKDQQGKPLLTKKSLVFLEPNRLDVMSQSSESELDLAKTMEWLENVTQENFNLSYDEFLQRVGVELDQIEFENTRLIVDLAIEYSIPFHFGSCYLNVHERYNNGNPFAVLKNGMITAACADLELLGNAHEQTLTVDFLPEHNWFCLTRNENGKLIVVSRGVNPLPL